MKEIIKTKLIENFIKENNLSKVGFCKLCKINRSTLNKILANNFNIRITALFKIARTMKIEIHRLFYC